MQIHLLLNIYIFASLSLILLQKTNIYKARTISLYGKLKYLEIYLIHFWYLFKLTKLICLASKVLIIIVDVLSI